MLWIYQNCENNYSAFKCSCALSCCCYVMKKYVEENKLQDRVIVPNDGEILKL